MMAFMSTDPDAELSKFLTRVISEIDNEPGLKKCAVVWPDSQGNTITAYLNCCSVDLQRMGDALGNEGVLRMIAENQDRLERLIDGINSEE